MAEDEYDCDLAGAQGKLVVFLASVLQRAGVVGAGEFGSLLSVFAEAVAETEAGEGQILARWASTVQQMAPP